MFFDTLELVEPGLVRAPEWRPDSPEDAANPAEMRGGVARKPQPPGCRVLQVLPRLGPYPPDGTERAAAAG